MAPKQQTLNSDTSLTHNEITVHVSRHFSSFYLKNAKHLTRKQSTSLDTVIHLQCLQLSVPASKCFFYFLISHEWIFFSFPPDAHFCQGSSVPTRGGGSKKAQMRHCTRVLRSVASSGEDSVNQDLCDQGAINQLLGKG